MLPGFCVVLWFKGLTAENAEEAQSAAEKKGTPDYFGFGNCLLA
jgi:hypothetical protein